MTTSDMPEEWRDVPGMEGLYQVSSHGRILSLVPWRGQHRRLLTPTKTAEGYDRVRLGTGDARRGYLVHVLTAAAFLGPRPVGHQVRHLDGNPANGHVSNLAYGTATDNALDSVDHGTHLHARKETCPRGHPYTHRNGRRVCLACGRIYTARYRARRRAEAAQ